MSENTLITKIKQEAETKAEAILAAAATEVEKIQRESEAAVEQVVSAQAAQLEKDKSQYELVAVSRAKQVSNISLQQAKRDQINSIFNEVSKKLTDLSGADYVNFFKDKAKQILPSDIEVVSVSAPAGKNQETKDVLAALNITADIKEDSSIDAGCVVVAKDGVYDVTLRRLFAEAREELEMEVVKAIAI